MATIFDAIHASQFSIFRLAIHHIDTIAVADTSESNTGVLLSVSCVSVINTNAHAAAKRPIPSHNSFFVHQLIGKA